MCAVAALLTLTPQVQQFYYKKSLRDLSQMQASVVPFNEKINAILDVTSNCKAANHRGVIIQRLQKLLQQRSSKQLQLHSLGACNKNADEQQLKEFDSLGKVKFAQRYKFCLVSQCLQRSPTT
jgi:hypothetical protein